MASENKLDIRDISEYIWKEKVIEGVFYKPVMEEDTYDKGVVVG